MREGTERRRYGSRVARTYFAVTYAVGMARSSAAWNMPVGQWFNVIGDGKHSASEDCCASPFNLLSQNAPTYVHWHMTALRLDTAAVDSGPFF